MGGESTMSNPIHTEVPIKQSLTLGKYPNTATYRKVLEAQRIMTARDGKLVWQKLPRDRPLYLFTVGLTAFGGMYLANVFYRMAFGIKKD